MSKRSSAGIYDARLAKRLIACARPYQAWLWFSFFLLVVSSILAVAGPYLTKVAVDRCLRPVPNSGSVLDPWLPAERSDALAAIAGLYLLVMAVGYVVRAAQIHAMNYAGQRVMQDLRGRLFAHLQRKGAAFFDRQAVGRLVSRVTTDVDALNDVFTMGLAAVAGDVLRIVFIVAVMATLSFKLTVAMFSLGPLAILASLVFRKYARAAFRDVRSAIGRLNGFLQEQITGIAAVQAFTHEKLSCEEFAALNDRHRRATLKAVRAHAFFFPTIEWLGMLGVAVLLVYGGIEVQSGAMTLGVVVAFLQYGQQIFRPVQDLAEKFNVLQAALAAAERIFGLLDTPVDEPASEEKGQPVSLDSAPRVEFRNVWFAYKDEDWVLRDVSFAVEPSETVALVGHTGAGKTSLVSLLLRFYEPQKGEILVAGRDVRDWPRDELRRRFGVVLQDPYLFTGTIESNIRFSALAMDEREIAAAARTVGLDRVVENLPNGYQEPIGEHGASLSSGQKQLLSFARAIAHNQQFLILDEATSSIDPATEFEVRAALGRLVEGHTSIVIAHRLSTIKRANRIIVMHKGRVRETGRHAELLAAKGLYWRLYQIQYRDQESDEAGRAEGLKPLSPNSEPRA